jgi:hypothetical protein
LSPKRVARTIGGAKDYDGQKVDQPACRYAHDSNLRCFD